MATARTGYCAGMDVVDLVTLLGEGHLEPDTLPDRLRELVDEALLRGLVIEDCRGRIVGL